MLQNNKIILERLSINNFATFISQEIIFSNNFNAIIGETGSGKSLVLEALQLILGHRADKKLIRQNADFAFIEATFSTNNKNIIDEFEKRGYPIENNEIVIKRIIYSNGKSKSFLNYQTTNLTTLQKISRRHIDLVGQFENQKLLNNKYQLKLLDSFAGLQSQIEKYSLVYDQIQQIKSEIDHNRKDLAQAEQRKDYLEYQINEISKLSPSTEDELDLIQRKESILLLKSESSIINNATNILSEAENYNVIELLGQTIKNLEKSANPLVANITSELHTSLQSLEETSFSLSKLLTDNFEQHELDNIIDRLDSYQVLKRKFGGSTKSIIEAYQVFQNELDSLSSLENRIVQNSITLENLKNQALEMATTIHQIRVSKAKVLSKELTTSVRELRMEGAIINIHINETSDLGPLGISNISFIAQTNPGEGFHKINEIASGGELSRILLSIRQILSSHDSISVFLFDEVDTGVGGQTAKAIGTVLKKVSKNSQVIAITHLPQIAAFTDKLIHVTKEQTTDPNNQKLIRTNSMITEITGDHIKDFALKMSSIS